MDDWVEVGVYAEGDQPPGLDVEQIGDADQPFYAQKHRIRSGQQTITVTMPRPAYANGSGGVSPNLREGGRPTSAVIDPNRLLIEVGGTADNTTTVKTSSFAVSTSRPRKSGISFESHEPLTKR